MDQLLAWVLVEFVVLGLWCVVFSCVFVGLQFRCFVFCACWVLLLGLVLVCFWCWLCFGYSWLIVLGMLFDFYLCL